MNAFRTIAALSATAALLTACGGGGGGGAGAPPVGAPQSDSSAGKVTLAAAFGAVSVAVSGKGRKPASGTRRPSFVTPGLQSLAIYDSTTLVYVANVNLSATSQFTTVFLNQNPRYNVTDASCTNNNTTETCNVTIEAKPGDHVFVLVAYPAPQTASAGGGPPSFTGIIASQGQVFVTLHPHETLPASVVMMGVASAGFVSGPEEAAYLATVQYTFQAWDSAERQILTPGAYDNGPVTISASNSNVVTIVPPTSFASPPSSPGDQTFTVLCSSPNGGTTGLLLSANTQPNTSYAAGLTYSGANYTSGELASAVLTCDAAPATIPITVQSHRTSAR